MSGDSGGVALEEGGEVPEMGIPTVGLSEDIYLIHTIPIRVEWIIQKRNRY